MALENLSQEDIFLLVKWLIVVVIWGLLAIGLYEDRARVRNLPDSSYVSELLQLLHRRNLYIYGLISMVLVMVIADDLNHMAERKQALATQKAETEALEPTQPQPQPAETTKFVVPHDSKVPFSDITEFNEANSKQQAYTDLLKQRYETWIITFYYLKKCNKVTDQDLSTIMTSLRKELATAKADNNVEANIVSAANGSYQEMYSEIPCDDAHINATKAGYDSTMQRIVTPTTSATAPTEKPKLAPTAPAAAPITPAVPATTAPQSPAATEQ